MSTIASGFQSPVASLRRAGALNFKIGATRSMASPLRSPVRTFRTASTLTPVRSASSLSEIPRPRCALPMISETLSSSGMAMPESGEGFGVAQGRDALQRNLLDPSRDFLDGVRRGGFLFDRSHGDIRNPARNDLVERREIPANVERKSMQRDP